MSNNGNSVIVIDKKISRTVYNKNEKKKRKEGVDR